MDRAGRRSSALGALALFLLVLTIGQLKSYEYIGSGVTATNTISVTGEGEVFAVPDTATFSFTVDQTAKDVASAQASATKTSNDVIAYLKQQGIADTDIQTTDYSINPQYSYQQAACPPIAPQVYNAGSVSGSAGGAIYCPPGKQTITGYEVAQTISVKVHDTSKAGTLLSGIGSRGVSNVSGLTFTVANQDTIDAQARDKAIAQAKTKAETLAKSLGVSIVRVVGFSENGNSPIPYYAKASGMALDSAAAPAPEIPTLFHIVPLL